MSLANFFSDRKLGNGTDKIQGRSAFQVALVRLV